MSFLSRLFGLGANRPETQDAIDPRLQPEVDQAHRLVDVINESLRVSNDSHVADTKVSRLEVAKARLTVLKALARRQPSIKLLSLDGVERDIARLEGEYANAGFYALSDQSAWDRRQDIARGFGYIENADILKGMRFCATLQLRTPLRVLTRHGEFHDGMKPPVIAREMWEGIWIPETNGLEELGLHLPPALMASDIGPVASDGGDYLPFLKAVRSVVEGDGCATARRARLIDALKMPTWAQFTEKLGGFETIADRFFPRFVDTITGVTASVSLELVKQGLATPLQLSAASDSVLLGVRGIGGAKLQAVREACVQAADKSDEYADRVAR